MKKSELRKIIREELNSLNIKKPIQIEEGLNSFAQKMINSIFNTIEKQQSAAANKALQNDPEYLEAVANVEKKAKEIDAYMDELSKKYNIKRY